MSKIVITAGGTGGHIFPALSVAKAIQDKYNNYDLLWIGTERSREREVCETNNIPVVMLNVIGINRKNPITAVLAVLKMIMAVLKVYNNFSKSRPQAVIAFGGYVCMPVLVAAKLKGIPSFIQEQNSVPGLVNRLMSNNAINTFLGLPLSEGYKLKGNTVITGNPVRQKEDSYNSITGTMELDTNKKTILICGGSQGAASMNRDLVEAVQKLSKDGYQIIWQTGVASHEEIKDKCKDLKSIWIYESLKDLYPYYYVADILVGRSGASTLAEAALFGLPAIMIPLPWSAEDHQMKNAVLVEKQGWGKVVKQGDDCSKNVLKNVIEILENSELRKKMNKSAFENSPEKSAELIATEVITGSEK